MTQIEAGYVAQGYELPPGCTWEMIARERVRYCINEMYVPVGRGPGCCAWGVPMIAGEFLSHDDSPRDLG